MCTASSPGMDCGFVVSLVRLGKPQGAVPLGPVVWLHTLLLAGTVQGLKYWQSLTPGIATLSANRQPCSTPGGVLQIWPLSERQADCTFVCLCVPDSAVGLRLCPETVGEEDAAAQQLDGRPGQRLRCGAAEAVEAGGNTNSCTC